MPSALLEKIHSFYVSVIKRSEETTKPSQTNFVVSTRATDKVGRSIEGGVRGQTCSYVMLEALNGKSFLICEGEGVILNISSLGMLLLMNEEPHTEQIVEVRASGSKPGPTVSLLEVSWTRQVLGEGDSKRYAVEGKFVFGPYAISERKLIQPLELA